MVFLDNSFHFFLSANWLQPFIMQAEGLAVVFSASCGVLFCVYCGRVFVPFGSFFCIVSGSSVSLVYFLSIPSNHSHFSGFPFLPCAALIMLSTLRVIS